MCLSREPERMGARAGCRVPFPPLSLNPRFVKRQRTHFLSPRRNGGGTRGARDEQGGLCEFAAGRSYPRVMARSCPLWLAGHPPHFVGENVRERGPCLHQDREERRWRETLSCQQTQPLCSTTSRRSRLRGGMRTRQPAQMHIHQGVWDRRAVAYPRILAVQLPYCVRGGR